MAWQSKWSARITRHPNFRPHHSNPRIDDRICVERSPTLHWGGWKKAGFIWKANGRRHCNIPNSLQQFLVSCVHFHFTFACVSVEMLSRHHFQTKELDFLLLIFVWTAFPHPYSSILAFRYVVKFLFKNIRVGVFLLPLVLVYEITHYHLLKGQ
ncbi:hypothetical protein AVEN_18732-1 [Araneus ventricosus]|uniref:Uncharacterized protein n=1 Tax=Araneus ventricosus TaxID=182803 RepID=A0A4Y2GN89_ARAVE|nr:hypothetical protein AVEN_18732-1 [Araneus ventricosus]